MRKRITQKEIDSVRFYQGDIRKRNIDGSFSQSEKGEGFREIRSAYKTLNCLMFSGIDNEIERIKEGNAKLNPEIVRHVDEVIEVYSDIFRVMCKCRDMEGPRGYIKAIRTERRISAEELKKGYTVSFTSVSKLDESETYSPEEFLLKKSGLTLLELLIPSCIPQIDYDELLGSNNLHPQQREVLLPPFLKIHMKEILLSESEKALQYPPEAKYLVVIEPNLDFTQLSREDAGDNIALVPAENEKAAAVLEKLIQGAEVSEEEIRDYCFWKAAFRNRIKEVFGQIFLDMQSEASETELENKIEHQWEILQGDVVRVLKRFKEEQDNYKKMLDSCNSILIIENATILAGVSFSFIPCIGDVMKCLAIVGGIASIMTTQHMKTKAYGVKAMQRRKTYLRLCDLRWKLKYEQNRNVKILQRFQNEFMEIMRADTEMSLQNLQMQIESGTEIYWEDGDLEKLTGIQK